jgi:DNA mismatch repair protein MutS2
MDRGLEVPALVLLDEVGSGTDPVEGGALGVAIVDHFRTRGATVLATSHYDALKTYASTTDGVATAAFGFDQDTFAPTYTIVYGSPGRSLALEIAGRLGLNPSIVSAARHNISEREAQLAEHLARIDRDVRALEHEQRLVIHEREALNATEARMRQREDVLKHREDTYKRQLNEQLENQVRQARREIDDVIADLKSKTAVLAQDAARHPVATGDAGSARVDARTAVESVARKILEPIAPTADEHRDSRPPAVGDRVAVSPFGMEGVVTAIHNDAVEVDVRGKRMRAHQRDLRVIGGAAPAVTAQVKVHVDLQPRDGSATDLNVIGCSVDEALSRTERFLDESLLTDHRTVRLIHGYGTGQLKRALAGFLQQHPLVVKFAAAPPEQGGGGVTVVELKE